MKRILALCLLAGPALLTAGCGISAVQADSAAQPEQRVYTTGSNIARRPTADAVGSDVTTVGPDAAEKQLNTRGMVPPPRGGGG